jgi:hypothetical protein
MDRVWEPNIPVRNLIVMFMMAIATWAPICAIAAALWSHHLARSEIVIAATEEGRPMVNLREPHHLRAPRGGNAKIKTKWRQRPSLVARIFDKSTSLN